MAMMPIAMATRPRISCVSEVGTNIDAFGSGRVLQALYARPLRTSAAILWRENCLFGRLLFRPKNPPDERTQSLRLLRHDRLLTRKEKLMDLLTILLIVLV